MGKGTFKEGMSFRREFSAGGVVYRKLKTQSSKLKIAWLVSRSAPSSLFPKAVWRLPKGWINEGASSRETAIREVKEEGGIEAKIVKKIGAITYFYNSSDKGRIFKSVTFYLMEWVKDLAEGFDEETSEIAWLPFDQAHQKLSYQGEKEILKKAQGLL